MSRSIVCVALGLTLTLAGLAGCATKKAAVYEHENFADSGTFSRSFPVAEAGSCEAARRALLSQGYIITSSDASQVAGNKSFQQNAENHLQISFNITCVPDSNDEQRSTIFANALQDRYALKKSNTSASVGVGVLGSLSMPIGSTDDSMVKVASETVSSAQFYDRYFALVESYLPKPRKASRLAPRTEAPSAVEPAPALGLPEPASPAPSDAQAAAGAQGAGSTEEARPSNAAASTSGAAQAQAPAAVPLDDSQGSQPVAPPVEPAPLEVQQPVEQLPVNQTPVNQTQSASPTQSE